MKELVADVARILNQNSFDEDYLCWRIVPYDDFSGYTLLDNLQKKYQRSMFPTTIIDCDDYVWINLYYLQDIAWRYGYFITNKEGDPMQRLMGLVIDEVQTKATTWLKLDINVRGTNLIDLYESSKIYEIVYDKPDFSKIHNIAEAVDTAIEHIKNS